MYHLHIDLKAVSRRVEVLKELKKLVILKGNDPVLDHSKEFLLIISTSERHYPNSGRASEKPGTKRLRMAASNLPPRIKVFLPDLSCMTNEEFDGSILPSRQIR